MTPCNIIFHEKLAVAQIAMTVSLLFEPNPFNSASGRGICSLGDQLLLSQKKMFYLAHQLADCLLCSR